MSRKPIHILIALILLIGLGTAFFIYKSNDHAECGTDIVFNRTIDGNLTRVSSHVCKESFSF